MKYKILASGLLVLVACSSSNDVQQEPKAQTVPQEQTVKTSQAKQWDGVYRFDVQNYKNSLEQDAQAKGKALNPKDLQMAEFFKPYKLSVKEDLARITLSSEVLEGKLAVLENSQTEARFKWTPQKEGEAESVLHFQDGTVKFERAGDLKQTLYFKKID